MITILNINRTISLFEFPDKYIITVYGRNLRSIQPMVIPESNLTLDFTLNQQNALTLLVHRKCILRQLKLTDSYIVIEIVDANNSTS